MNCTVSAVIHSHHQLLNGGIKASYRHLLEQPQLVDRLIVLTDEQWQDLQQRIPGARLVVIPNHMDDSKIPVNPQRSPQKRSFTARYSEEKQHLTLFNAFRKVSAQRPDARLHTYGVGPLRRKLSDQVKAWGLEDVIKSTDLPRILLPFIDTLAVRSSVQIRRAISVGGRGHGLRHAVN